MKGAGMILTVALLAVLAGGCGNGPAAQEPRHQESPAMPNLEPPRPTGPAAAAVADLAKRLGVEEREIRIVAVQEVTWRDGSLGCPEPGKVYTQALVEGTRVLLRLRGTSYAYHAGGGRPPFLCEHPRRPLGTS